jgi:hypothetical protein
VLDRPDDKNTGNFSVETVRGSSCGKQGGESTSSAAGRQANGGGGGGGGVLWPYGFVDTTAAKMKLLGRIQESLGAQH